MKLDGLIKRQVSTAFRLLDDLATDVTLLQSTSATGYDFNANSTVGAVTSTKVIKGIIQNKKKSRDSTTNLTALILKATDVNDPSIYDTFIINGVTWSGVPPYLNDGYLITIDITKEG